MDDTKTKHKKEHWFVNTKPSFFAPTGILLPAGWRAFLFIFLDVSWCYGCFHFASKFAATGHQNEATIFGLLFALGVVVALLTIAARTRNL